ncbi:type I secretion system permease/ATPase [Paramagnetospirillum kuznetsovii]|uniref:Type I secretion system permease/ATPase n=1 Tax=Paramagnetospirillum kuznetsovii TaxID=2053833 RepID=A0A364NSR2_9PROT|nr:type I secretion system permease/ATPase [Paramagnetospirillum kuznetsovii]RAU20104.1 type I secretion system permease/ATPase [Paramagnetospirillum kuznetsovii]
MIATSNADSTVAEAPKPPKLDERWLSLSQYERDDPLLECLAFLTRHHGRPKSPEVLTAGLPMTGPRIGPDLFIRAAERVGLHARIVKRTLDELPDLILPAVLVMSDESAGVLVSRSNVGQLEVFWPTVGGVEPIGAEELAPNYSGFAILVRPVHDYHAPSASTVFEAVEGKDWFWKSIFLSRSIYFQVCLAAVVINLFALAVPIFSMALYDRIIPNGAYDTLWVLSSGVGIVLIFDFIIKTLRGYLIEVAGKRADVTLACRLFDQVLNIKMVARPPSAGGFAGTLREFETLREFFTSATLTTIIDLPFIFLFIAVIGFVSGPVALVLVAVIPLILGYGLLIQIPLNAIIRRHFQEGQDKHGILVETINGLETIKGVGADGRMRNLWEAYVGRSARSSEKARAMSMSAVNFAGFLQQAATVGVMIYGVHLVLTGQLTMGGLIACTTLSGRAIAPLGQFAQLLARLNQSLTSLKALNKLMDAPTERSPTQTFLHRPRLSGRITFDQVSFAYPERNNDALKDVRLTIKAGEKVAFIGKVGSGKSTIAKLILGLYEPTQGAVLADDTDLRQIDPVDLRRNIGYVAQDPFLFRGTVRDNISAAMPFADDSWVMHAAELAGVDEFVHQTSSGYDLSVGERGEGLSGGQRQLVTIARAILRDPPIFVFDEPTSAMDARSEDALVARLRPSIAGKTIILITHRGSLLSLVDRIVVLDGGRVVADGPRASVLDALAAGRISTAKHS